MESSNGMSQGQDTSSSPGSVPSPAPVQQQTAPVTTSDERVLRQSEVNDIVKRAKLSAVDDYKRLQSEQPNYFNQKYGDGVQTQQPVNQNASTPNETHYRQIAAQEAQRLRDEWVQEARTKSEAEHAQRIVQNFWSKISPGKEKYQDFEKVTGDIEYARFPNVVQMLSEHIDNAHDVLYAFGNDRMKMAQLEQLATMSPRDAIQHAQRLSQSLKDNDKASKVRMPNEPLDHLRPSNTGTDNGVMSVKDLRAKYRA